MRLRVPDLQWRGESTAGGVCENGVRHVLLCQELTSEDAERP